MRVLIVSQYFWPENFPINDLARGLRQKGHDITVLTGMPNYPEGRFYPGYRAFPIRRDHHEGIKIVRVPMVPKGNGNAIRMVLYYWSLALSACLLVPLFFRNRVDLAFVYQPSPITVGLPALVLKAIEKTPVWIWVQDLWPETLAGTEMVRSSFLLKLTDRLVRFIYSKCDRVLVQSQEFVPRMVKKGVPRERIRFFPNSAPELYKPAVVESDASERNLMPQGFRVLFAGNIGRAQDMPTILAAAEKLKQEVDIHWVILGDGPKRSWVEERIKARGLEKTVHLLGRYPEQTMPRFFSLADALLVTLKKDPVFALTIPSKVQSYLACGRPIVAALDGEGARVIDESGGGVTVPAGDADALAEVVMKMYEMPKSELERMGRLSREYSEIHFERNTLLDKLDRWMKEEVGR
jgi:glycosyltransferase involved in cell wall biosynthesis